MFASWILIGTGDSPAEEGGAYWSHQCAQGGHPTAQELHQGTLQCPTPSPRQEQVISYNDHSNKYWNDVAEPIKSTLTFRKVVIPQVIVSLYHFIHCRCLPDTEFQLNIPLQQHLPVWHSWRVHLLAVLCQFMWLLPRFIFNALLIMKRSMFCHHVITLTYRQNLFSST